MHIGAIVLVATLWALLRAARAPDSDSAEDERGPPNYQRRWNPYFYPSPSNATACGRSPFRPYRFVRVCDPDFILDEAYGQGQYDYYFSIALLNDVIRGIWSDRTMDSTLFAEALSKRAWANDISQCSQLHIRRSIIIVFIKQKRQMSIRTDPWSNIQLSTQRLLADAYRLENLSDRLGIYLALRQLVQNAIQDIVQKHMQIDADQQEYEARRTPQRWLQTAEFRWVLIVIATVTLLGVGCLLSFLCSLTKLDYALASNRLRSSRRHTVAAAAIQNAPARRLLPERKPVAVANNQRWPSSSHFHL